MGLPAFAQRKGPKLSQNCCSTTGLRMLAAAEALARIRWLAGLIAMARFWNVSGSTSRASVSAPLWALIAARTLLRSVRPVPNAVWLSLTNEETSFSAVDNAPTVSVSDLELSASNPVAAVTFVEN